MDAGKLATLVRMHEAHSVTSSFKDSQTQSAVAKVRLTKAYAIVAYAARDGDKLKKTLRETLESEAAVGRSAYTTQLSFYALVEVVIWALGAPQDSHEGEKLRATVFVTSLQLLHSTNAATIAQRCVPLLLEELHSLRVTDLATAVSELLRGVQQSQRAQRQGDALAVFYTIELLPQLLLRVSKSMTVSFEASQADSDVGDLSGPHYRQRVLTKLSELAWPRRFFLQVLKNFRDFTLTLEEERTFCIKIYQEARKELHTATHQVRSLEIFPTVCLGVLQLVGRTQNVLSTRLLTRLLINKCQQLTTSASDRDGGATALDHGRPELSERELRQLQSTVLYHVDVAMRQWERLGEAIKIEYEQRASQRLSSFDIALMLLIANHRKYEQSMLQLLLRHVVSTYMLKHQRGSDGRDEALARRDYLSVVQHAFDGNWTQVVLQMIELGFQLVEYRGLKSDSQQQRVSDGHTDTGNTSEWVEFGIRLLLACFQHHVPVREKVLDRVVNMIVVQNTDCRIYIYVLSRLVSRHIAELDGGLEVRVRECLEYVTQLDPVLANSLLVALSPLLKVQHNLKEFVILVLRKAMFRKDEDSRIIGIQGFALLLCLSSRIFSRSRTLSQLYSQNVTMLSQGVGGGASSIHNPSGVDTDIASQEHQHAIAAEDLYRQFAGIFRKALQLQTRVRAVLYAELVKVFMECPALQQAIMKLLFQHYQKYYEFNETMQPPLKLDLSLSRKRGIYEEPLQYLMHTMLYCHEEIKRDIADLDDEETMMDDIPATQAGGANQAIEVMEQNVSILFERLKRCELSDFEFDKNATFSADSELGDTNRRLGFLVMGVIQVAINWSVSHCHIDDKSNGNDIRESWDVILRYAHIYLWLQRKLLGLEIPNKLIQPGKKRKLEKAHVKQDTSVTGRTSGSSAGTADKLVTVSFELCANLQWATLLTPDTLLSILAFATTRARSGGLTPDEEEFVLVVVEKSINMLDLIQRRQTNERQTDAKQRRSSGSVEKFRPDEFTQQLSDLFLRLLRVYTNEEVSLILPKGSSTRKRASAESAQPQERMRRIVQACVRGFAWITDMWSCRPHEEFGELMTRALCLKSGDDEESPDYDIEGEENDGIVSVVAPLRKLIDDLVSQEMPEEANRLLDVMQTVWTKLSAGSSSSEELTPHVEWVKELLVDRSGQASPRLLEKYVSMLLRPSANAAFRYDTAQQLAQGLRHICNSGDDDAEQDVDNDAQRVISFGRFNDKHILTVANAILAKIDESLADTERCVKAYDSEQRRQSLKFKEDDLNALQQLEDETGSQVFRRDTEGGQAGRFVVFKSLCKQSFDVAGSIRPFVEMSLNNTIASIRIVRLAGRLYKLLVVLLRDKQRRKDASLPRFLRQLFDRVASNLSPALLKFIACIHGESIKAAPKKRASKMATSTKTMTGNSKFIPEVVFQLEQFDLVMIKLSKLCKGHDFNVWCKLRPVIDFRFDKAILKRALKDNITKKREGAEMESAVQGSDGEGEVGESLSAEVTITDIGSAANPDDDGAPSDDEDTESAEDGDDGDTAVELRGGSSKRRRIQQAIAEDSDGEAPVDVGGDVEDEEESDDTGEVEIGAVDEGQSEEEYATYDSLASNEI